MVAAPGDPGNGVPLARLAERVTIDIAYGGSCTAGKREDFDRYHEVLAWALAQGSRSLHTSSCTCSSARQPCATTARSAATLTFRAGWRRVAGAELRRLRQLWPGLIHPRGPGDGQRHQPQFSRSIRPGKVWLASPPTVAASAIAGMLVSFDELRQQHAA